MVESAAAATSQFFSQYEGLIAAGVLPETDWITIAMGVSAVLADAVQTGRPVPLGLEPLVAELVRRLLVRPSQLVGVHFESSGAPAGITVES